MTREDWEIVKLGDVIKCYNGKSVKALNEGAFKVFGSNGIIGYFDSFNYENCIILGRVGAYCGSVNYEKNKFFASDNTIVVDILNKNKVDIYFLYYLFITLKLRDLAGGAAQPLINQGIVYGIEISLPPLAEQQRIASILSAYDDLIENNTRRIALLEQMAQTLYRQWFVHYRFPGYEKVQMVDSGTDFSLIPEGWEVKGILDIEYFRFINENISYFDGKKTYYATADIECIDIVGEGEGIDRETKPSRAQKQPLPNSVWFARMANTYKVRGYSQVNTDDANNSVLSSGMVGFESNEAHLSFLFFTINNTWFHDVKDSYATGSTQVSLTNDGLSKIKVVIPSKPLIEIYSKLINPMLDEIFSLQKQNQNLKKTRDLLLPRLMSGEIEV